MTGEELEQLVVRCLERGVPPSDVADIFDLDATLVKATLSEVRIKDYGTDDDAEYMEQLKWDAMAEARRIIEHGSAAEKARILGMVLGKQVALSARRTPESVRNSQDAVIDLFKEMREGPAHKQAPRSRFVARLENDASA